MIIHLISPDTFRLDKSQTGALDGLDMDQLAIFLYQCYELTIKWGLDHPQKRVFVVCIDQYGLIITLLASDLCMTLDLLHGPTQTRYPQSKFKSSGGFKITMPIFSLDHFSMFSDQFDKLKTIGESKNLVNVDNTLKSDDGYEMIRISGHYDCSPEGITHFEELIRSLKKSKFMANAYDFFKDKLQTLK